MGRPPKAEARETRQEILDAALGLFSRQTYAGTSMRQIAHAVGVRESALYHHFGSKHDIFQALSHELGPGKSELLREVPIDEVVSQGPEQFLQLMGEKIFTDWMTPRERKFGRLMMAEQLRLSEAGQSGMVEALARAHANLTWFFRQLIKRKQLIQIDPELAALEFIGPLVMLRLKHLILNPGRPDARMLLRRVHQHIEHFWSSVGARP